MIDTIVIRVLNLSKYPKIYEQFYAPSRKKGDLTLAHVDKDTGEITERAKTTAYIYHDTNRVLPLTYRSSLDIASSHYSLSYSINTGKDYIEFNFSIPKYIYGTNLFQFVSIFDQSVRFSFLQLKAFLQTFLKQNFIHTPLLEDIEINRIDLCYNQFFNCKEDALHYLDEQKQLLVKYARSSKNNYRSYDTSLMYITKRYSFKIYHKGTEFQKHDFKQIIKQGNKQNYPMQKFQELADCILRYEMTFRRSYLNYLCKHYFFNSVTFSQHPYYEGHVLAKLGKFLAREAPRERHKGREKHETALEYYLSRPKHYTLKSMFDSTLNPFALIETDAITFDEDIFGILHKTFWEKVRQYQLTHVVDAFEIKRRIDELNEKTNMKNQLRRKQTFGKDNRLLYAALLSNFMKVEEFKGFLPERTYFDLKRDLKLIGITSQNAAINIPTPKLDYLDYKLYFSEYHNSKH